MRFSAKRKIAIAWLCAGYRRMVGREAHTCGGAWMRTEFGTAIICASCHSREWDEARAIVAGLPMSHGICEHCLRRDYPEYAQHALAMAAGKIEPLFFAHDLREIDQGDTRSSAQGHNPKTTEEA